MSDNFNPNPKTKTFTNSGVLRLSNFDGVYEEVFAHCARIRRQFNKKNYLFGTRSASVIEHRKLHPDLCKIAKVAIAITGTDFGIYEGVREWSKQKEYIEKGVSMTHKSRHLSGHAIDLVPIIDGKARWDKEAYIPVSHALFEATHYLANIGDVPHGALQWGGTWQNFPDYPHFQLARAYYTEDKTYCTPPIPDELQEWFEAYVASKHKHIAEAPTQKAEQEA